MRGYSSQSHSLPIPVPVDVEGEVTAHNDIHFPLLTSRERLQLTAPLAYSFRLAAMDTAASLHFISFVVLCSLL